MGKDGQKNSSAAFYKRGGTEARCLSTLKKRGRGDLHRISAASAAEVPAQQAQPAH